MSDSRPVVTNPDPTENVRQLVIAESRRLDERVTHVEAVGALRSHYEDMLRNAESRRLDAIRAVDVSAVSVAADRAAQTAATLAATVQASAEALRAQVEAIKQASAKGEGRSGISNQVVAILAGVVGAILAVVAERMLTGR